MPRPKKVGLDYYYKGVDDLEDYRMIELVEEYGAMGYMVFDIVLSKVYKNGYYLEMPIERLAILISRLIGNRWIRDKNEIVSIINYCGEIGLLDKQLLVQGVVTSKEIQQHYSCVSARRKMDKTKYWLLPTDEKEEASATETSENEAIVGVSATETRENATISTQRKEKKRKENEIKSSNQIKPNQTRDAKTAKNETREIDDDDVNKIDKVFYSATGRSLSSEDKREVYRLKSEGCPNEIIVESIRDVSPRAHKPISSFAYFVKDIHMRMDIYNSRFPPTSQISDIESILNDEWMSYPVGKDEDYVYDD